MLCCGCCRVWKGCGKGMEEGGGSAAAGSPQRACLAAQSLAKMPKLATGQSVAAKGRLLGTGLTPARLGCLSTPALQPWCPHQGKACTLRQRAACVRTLLQWPLN